MPIFSPSPHFFPLTPLSLTNLSSTSCLCTLIFPPLPSLLPHSPHFSPTPLTSPTLPSLLPHSPHFSPTPLTSHLLPSLLPHSTNIFPLHLSHPLPTSFLSPMHSHLISIQTLSSPPSSHLYLFSFPRAHPPTSPISTQPS